MEKIANPLEKDWLLLLKRPIVNSKNTEEMIKGIFKEVEVKGDTAIKKYTSFFDGVNLNEFKVSKAEIDIAAQEVSKELKDAIQVAKATIEKFHTAQKTSEIEVETTEGVICWQKKKPIQKIGLYIPGGSAPLFSTVLMLGVPAQLAGCKQIVLCSPADKNGKINAAVLYTAQLCGITEIFKIGGIQAIAGMTFGTATLPKVFKIFGPGNQYVTASKQFATQFGVAIDMPAGPSELLVFSDESGNPEFIAADLLSQAEHGPDSQVILVSTSKKLLRLVENQISEQLKMLPRKEIAQKAIENSKLIYVKNEEIALRLINEYAPEHFIVCSKNEDYFAEGIQNAGSVFLGNYTPESAGDYASGTNHTLPTNGFAKNYSGVNLDSFMKSMTFQKISPKGIQNIGSVVERMAAAEGLDAHKKAISVRLKSLEYGNQ